MPDGLLIDDHMEGFELKVRYLKILGDILEFNPNVTYHQLYSAIEAIAPDYIAAAHARRKCHRTLRYIGCTWNEDEPPVDDEFFKLGQVYVSSTFNGGTYTIDEYGERPIGCAYFEWLKGDSDSLEPL